ncbi:MAG: TIGR01777 family oxidoreductase [Thermodesulfobacteriota bacterium]|nr:TIGR01777 family oxidoreductase [Thermodesulfobacteriota bacterium]
MKFFIMGGTGFIGGPLIRHISRAGHEVTALARNDSRVEYLPPQVISLVDDPLKPGNWQEIAGQADVIINLVGKPIMTRWTKNARKEILESRILATRMAVEAIPLEKAGRMTLINANAVGYYEGSGNTFVTEKSPPGNGFLAEICQRWQQEAEAGIEKGARVIIPRFGAVLGKEGGALAQMLPPFRLGLGGKLGSGRQWFSWIHMHDLIRAMLFVVENKKLAGVVNMCSPEPVTNQELTQTLSKALNRPAILPVPGIILKLAIGGSAEIALKGQRVLPEVLNLAGFTFDFPSLEATLNHLLRSASSSAP